jgi:protein-tyrosine phosphatase
MAEALLTRRLLDAGVAATVSSAGLLPGGAPATGHAADTLARRGLDLSGHRSRSLDRSLVDGADLVLGMTREHVREVAVLDPDAYARSFTLKELVRLGERAGPRRSDESLTEWLGRVGESRDRGSLLTAGVDPELDIADPVGGPRSGYERTASEIDDLLERLVTMLWPDAAADRERSA